MALTVVSAPLERILRRRNPPDPADALDAVAEQVARLAALHRAGVPPALAWDALAGESSASDPARLGDSAVAAAVAAALRAGLPLPDPPAIGPDRLRRDAWRQVVALVDLAARLGAPLASTLDRTAAHLSAGAAAHRAVAAAAAGPAASARLMVVLPPCTALLAAALGFDVLPVLATPLGAAATAAALALLLVARRWSARLVAAALEVPWRAGLGLELAAVAVRAGAPPAAAEPRAPDPADPVAAADVAAVAAVVAFAARAGAPLAALLEGEAERRRRLVLADAVRRAAVLPARLLVPLGACVLPAFVLVGVLPLGLAVLSSTALPR